MHPFANCLEKKQQNKKGLKCQRIQIWKENARFAEYCFLSLSTVRNIARIAEKAQTEKKKLWDNGVWYCSEKHRIEQARQLGTLHICLRCHKEFVGYNKTYCSKECFQADIPRRAAERKAEREKPERICKECGRIYLKTDAKKARLRHF